MLEITLEDQDYEIVAALIRDLGIPASVDCNDSDQIFVLVGDREENSVALRLHEGTLSARWLGCFHLTFDLTNPSSLRSLKTRLEWCRKFDQSCEYDEEECPHKGWPRGD
jgi:hypothetical protein